MDISVKAMTDSSAGFAASPARLVEYGKKHFFRSLTAERKRRVPPSDLKMPQFLRYQSDIHFSQLDIEPLRLKFCGKEKTPAAAKL